MKKLLSILSLVMLFSCSENAGDVDVLDGVYVDEYENCCLIINEYEKGKLGYHLFDINDGISSETFLDSYVQGTLSIKTEGKDSIALFKERKNKAKESSVFPIFYDTQSKIRYSEDILFLGDTPKATVCFGKMKVEGEIKEIKEAVKAAMGATFNGK